jgi:hypothetical protein
VAFEDSIHILRYVPNKSEKELESKKIKNKSNKSIKNRFVNSSLLSFNG